MHNQHNGTEAALTISSVHFDYPNQPGILNNIQVQIAADERIGLIGPNGSGKTTLFLTICGILRPTAGAVHLFGETVKVGGFRPEIGFVFQNPNDQLFCPSVQEDVAFGPTNMGLPQDEVTTRVEAAMATTGVSHLAQRAPHHLSGGEKRMVAIASVLAMHPRLIIYDEPEANLDSVARRRLIHFLQASQETLILSSHDLEFVLEVCSRVIMIHKGQIVADGLPRDVMGDAALMEQYGLERPYSLIAEQTAHT
ncbi:MAG: ABC transporter ATP-binding protein [Chloroflexi bacterium AL-W]|nr:ABC transporter ATP-binding protein [Chloroflexi bacterium AL-N1]NOK67880.1 ABC transporter ATP-binding protein [Chloroflexi bacterium AL-N10]NOK75350.1 ABC transporter ATP-binding protein [Chloroflexi bacterium AL-N5]NOK82138.1 ABC transporter ATP-binding protein [Chloroflexi bacterium AL-W]NOK89983.1 ABC transporter ATP-binding protein [Chloroflexi bacterium AL-N15]